MAVPFTQIATEALYATSKDISDLISQQVGLVGVLGAKGRIQVITGGLGWQERVFYGNNSNDGHRSYKAQIPTDLMENMTMAKFDPAHFNTSIVVNKVEVAQAQGESQLGDLVADAKEVAKASAVSNIGSALFASTQVNSNYPIPLPVMIPATLPASQTGVDRGGINSATNTWWRTYCNTDTIADLGAAAGLRYLDLIIRKTSRSSAAIAQPDFGITTAALFGRLTSTNDNLRRFTTDDTILKLGFANVKYMNMAIIYDANCPASSFFALNTRTLRIKALKMPNIQNVTAKGNQLGLPMVIEPMKDDIDTLNYVSLMHITYNLTCNDLASNGRLSVCTE